MGGGPGRAARLVAFLAKEADLGITTGTTPTTYDPTSSVSRLQMAAFLSRSVDGVLRRGSRRALLNQFWTTQDTDLLGLTTVGSNPSLDGSRIWTANGIGGSVSIVTPGATIPWTVTTVMTGFTSPNGFVFDGANVWVLSGPAATA